MPRFGEQDARLAERQAHEPRQRRRCSARGEDDLQRVERGERAAGRDLLHDHAQRARPACAGRYRTSGTSGMPLIRASASSRLAPTTRGHVDLVRLAVRLLLGLGADDVHDLARVAAVAVVEEPLAVAEDDRVGGGVLADRRGEGLRRLLEDARARAPVNVFQISAGKVPPATGPPSNSVSIGLSSFG